LDDDDDDDDYYYYYYYYTLTINNLRMHVLPKCYWSIIPIHASFYIKINIILWLLVIKTMPIFLHYVFSNLGVYDMIIFVVGVTSRCQKSKPVGGVYML